MKRHQVTHIHFGGPFTYHKIEGQIKQTISFGGVIFLHAHAPKFVKHREKREQLLSQTEIIPSILDENLDFELLSHVSTDHIISVAHILTDDQTLLGKRALVGLPTEYQIEHGTLHKLRGTVLAAGEAFGIGSSREQAVTCLLHAGITAVLAPSFGPIFEKNAAHAGLLTSTNINLAKKIQKGLAVPFSEFLKGKDPLLQKIIRAGGLMHYLKKISSSHPIKRKLKTKAIPTPMNVWQKRLARIVGSPFIKTGDTILLPVHEAYSYVALSGPARTAMIDSYGQVKAKLKGSQIKFFEDHFAYSTKPEIAQLTQNQRQFAQELGIPKENYYKGKLEEGGGAGISHRVMLEQINPRKSQVVIATDSHTPTLGALPIIALPVGSTFFAAALAEGVIPLSVGKVLRVNFVGQLPAGLTIRDAQLELAATVKPPVRTSVVEFGGSGLDNLTFSQVAALGNMVPEVFWGDIAVTQTFKSGVFYLQQKYNLSETQVLNLYGMPDPNCDYALIVNYDLSTASPWIALPGNPKNSLPLSHLKEHPQVQKAVIASCTNGIEELAEAAAVLYKQKIASHTKFLIIPSSKYVYELAEQKGYMKILRQAGAKVQKESVCSVCIGDGPDAIKEGEVAISATNRNFRGRMGNKKADVYLGGSILTALSALLGHIPSSHEYQKEIARITQELKFLNNRQGL